MTGSNRSKVFFKESDFISFFRELPFELVYTPKILNQYEFPTVWDPKDSPILTMVILENVDVFITGDKDFLVLDTKIPNIVTMTEFWNDFNEVRRGREI